MTEALALPIPDPEVDQIPEAVETKGNIKKYAFTGLALSATGLVAWYLEARGYAAGLPPPTHSFKHPAVGYNSALLASRVYRQRSNSAAVAGGIVGNIAAESGQDIVNSQDHYPFHWLNFHEQRSEGNFDNFIDFCVCMGGTALLLAQNNNAVSRVRAKVSDLRAKFHEAPASPVFNPAK